MTKLMVLDWETILFLVLSFFCITHYNCNAQTITVCENNIEITLNANESYNYIRSFNYPGDYANTDYGDCKITIYVNGSYVINVTINGFIKRNYANTLKFYDGIDDDSDILQSPTLNQTYTSSGSYLYMTQWSFGSTNDAFEIAYIAVEKSHSEETNESNMAWMFVFIPIGIFFLWILCSIRDKRKKQMEAARQASQALETQVNEKDPVSIKESGDTAKAKQINMTENRGKDNIFIDVPLPYVLLAETKTRNPILNPRVSPSAPVPSSPPPPYTSMMHDFSTETNFNPSVQGYMPNLPHVDSDGFPQAAQYDPLPTPGSTLPPKN